jgi:hypothetical protein
MRVLHFDCFSGISGDMTLAALIDLGVDVNIIRQVLASMELPITLELEKVKRNGIAANKVNVIAPEQDEHRYLADVEAILDRADLTAPQRDLAKRIFRKLAEAEAFVHNMPLEKVHFHEVGALDSIADITGVAVALDLLKVDRITSRSVPTGKGTVQCAHGRMPIPAPATAKLLEGVPLAQAPVSGELTTPTGAAILATIVQEFTDQPTFRLERIGCGAGTRNPIELPNILRVFLGQTDESTLFDTIVLLETNLDDVPAEILGYTQEKLFQAGAADVFTIPIGMKKNRPGVLLSVLCSPALVPQCEEILFRETGTFGIRKCTYQRSVLARESLTLPTAWGEVRVKRGWRGDFQILTPEYEDCARIAREKNLPLREVYAAITQEITRRGGE